MGHCSRQSIAAHTRSRDNNVALMRKYTKLLGMKCLMPCALCLVLCFMARHASLPETLGPALLYLLAIGGRPLKPIRFDSNDTNRFVVIQFDCHGRGKNAINRQTYIDTKKYIYVSYMAEDICPLQYAITLSICLDYLFCDCTELPSVLLVFLGKLPSYTL